MRANDAVVRPWALRTTTAWLRQTVPPKPSIDLRQSYGATPFQIPSPQSRTLSAIHHQCPFHTVRYRNEANFRSYPADEPMTHGHCKERTPWPRNDVLY